MRYDLGCVGGGNMAEAIVHAGIAAGVLDPARVIVADPTAERAAVYEAMGVAFTTDNMAVIAESSQVMLAIKPQVFPKVAAGLAAASGEQVLVSIMAGLTSVKIAEGVGRACRVVRVMPNTPVMAGVGMAGIALGPDAMPGDDELAYRLFSAGRNVAIRVPEDRLDAVTAVSGSGPAYVFLLAEAMSRAAVELGLAEHADTFVAQTLLGAATLLSESEDDAMTLRKKVTSPNGTTQAAIEAMQANGMPEAVIAGVKAAAARSLELGG